MFSKVLIANRGEIAVRCIRACRDMGIATVAVFAEVDRPSLAVRLADEAYQLEGESPRAAYLDPEQIVAVARQAGAEAVHPGYGFLSENPRFARACQDAGIVFVGPSAEVIESLGDKNRARELMAAAGVPLVPGTPRPLEDGDEAAREAERIGYPVLLKAAGGGGGRGMRLAFHEAEVRAGFEQARREAMAAFGSPSIYLEKYLERPRHIEIQVLGDSHGQAVHLFERECSVQRRFQKMFEEAPSPFLDEATRQAMGEAAVRGARQVGYCGAGTFEFLVDQNRNFYFLEVNTRLQVEHPVTEMITGVDLVAAQLRVASGEKLWFGQDDVSRRGWAMECRITCEDPFQKFVPAPGRVTNLRFPAGPGVRVDSHLYPGYEVPVDFDSMVGKLVVWGADRDEARRRTLGALAEFQLAGFPSSIVFHRWLLQHSEFIAGNLSTHFLGDHLSELASLPSEDGAALAALARALELFHATAEPGPAAGGAEDDVSAWRRAGRWAAVGGGGRDIPS